MSFLLLDAREVGLPEAIAQRLLQNSVKCLVSDGKKDRLLELLPSFSDVDGEHRLKVETLDEEGDHNELSCMTRPWPRDRSPAIGAMWVEISLARRVSILLLRPFWLKIHRQLLFWGAGANCVGQSCFLPHGTGRKITMPLPRSSHRPEFAALQGRVSTFRGRSNGVHALFR